MWTGVTHIARWFLAVHSLGGVGAARYVALEGQGVPIDGLIFWASFSSTALPTTAIFGSLDLFRTVDEINDSKALPPAATRYVEIPGGNHARFGFYGDQEGDGEALIDHP